MEAGAGDGEMRRMREARLSANALQPMPATRVSPLFPRVSRAEDGAALREHPQTSGSLNHRPSHAPVAAARAGLMAMLERYSAIGANNPRAREVRTYPWGDVPGKSARFNERWAELHELVTEVLAGEHKDPCPRALHWGGPGIDEPRGRMVPAKCAAPTANTFYALGRKP